MDIGRGGIWAQSPPPPPPHLIIIAQSFLLNLKGAALVHQYLRDSRGWGTRGYSVKEGSMDFLRQNNLPDKSNMWKNIWNNDGLPKINIFCWILAHGKLITGDNLNKRGFQGPFRCAMCCQNLERTHHLFSDCEFSKQVWHLVYLELIHKISWPATSKTLLVK
jgi:hypothetical protein